MNNEPLWTVAGVTAAVTALISLLTAFGLDLTKEQASAILGITAVLAPSVVAWIARSKVTPAWKVAPQDPGVTRL